MCGGGCVQLGRYRVLKPFAAVKKMPHVLKRSDKSDVGLTYLLAEFDRLPPTTTNNTPLTILL